MIQFIFVELVAKIKVKITLKIKEKGKKRSGEVEEWEGERWEAEGEKYREEVQSKSEEQGMSLILWPGADGPKGGGAAEFRLTKV